MCGIFGYIGPKDAVKTTLAGLKKLEYRGYDSAGIAGVKNGQILHCKEVGKVSILESRVEQSHLSLDIAIAQTRWATHGKPSKVNAHPHFDQKQSLALVHNGIIENHSALRKMLAEKGIECISQTDTEVVAHLIGLFYQGDLLKAVQKAVTLLKGAFAIALVHCDFPDQIIAIAHQSTLLVGIGENEAFISSDSYAFAEHTREVIYLENSEIAVVHANKVDIYDSTHAKISKKIEKLPVTSGDSSKGHFDHYTLKEIHEQPQTIHRALMSRINEEFGTAEFEELNSDTIDFTSIERILIVACGTSWHAGCLAQYMFEDKARIPVQVEIASEFRYKNPVILPNTLAIAISQSGETADTVAAVRELKAKGSKVLSICNVQGSTLVRESDTSIFLRAGPEIGVCSTKAFTSQVTVLALLCLMMARMRHMGKQEGQDFLYALRSLPENVQVILDNSHQIESIAKKYASFQNFFFLGRHYMFPTCLEGALKLKEISYINANGYPAGEMKHGPIALINEECPTVALCANQMTFEKLHSNLMEVKSRSGPIIAIAQKDCDHCSEDQDALDDVADDIVWVPAITDALAPIPTAVVMQLLAYYIAKERGTDIDQPRNLAKSVTVE
ncbi:MAG: glutamine--fructose-6-phosphate transaminase (isomerizing) [Parachlamydiaceae bacterium]|nr:glutamine--fructose-6-phosphate transaminase (isomerizing) [Parachlamydiaceae bacterium]